ncbi:MAG: helix-turn-helix domain-containing protein [Deltaproteobacteria bacterium]|jgi:transcriptional regulator with XRE-family HTH domain|nr:helix-turn-helix domain-containing protein [Deltaproteobacteria bacterium]
MPAMLLRGYRGKHDMTQKALAKKLGVTQNRVSDMERGKRPISKDIAVMLEHFHFENALTADSASIGSAHEE